MLCQSDLIYIGFMYQGYLLIFPQLYFLILEENFPILMLDHYILMIVQFWILILKLESYYYLGIKYRKLNLRKSNLKDLILGLAKQLTNPILRIINSNLICLGPNEVCIVLQSVGNDEMAKVRIYMNISKSNFVCMVVCSISTHHIVLFH